LILVAVALVTIDVQVTDAMVVAGLCGLGLVMNPNNPWERPAPVAVGDADNNTTYAAVGRALSNWERLEGYLSLIFSAMVGPGEEPLAASRAYGSVASFIGRNEMLWAAAEAYLSLHPDALLQASLETILKEAKKASPRRNEIAHGIVQPLMAMDRSITWALVPAYYATNKRNLDRSPKYAFSSIEIMGFGHKFNELADPTEQLLTDLYARHP